MSKLVVPVVMNDDGSRHEPLAEGEALVVSAVPVSTDRRNLLETDDTGLLLTGDMLVSQDENNPIINNVDGKLYLRAADMLSPENKALKVADNLLSVDSAALVDDLVSSQSGNMIEVKDDKLYVPQAFGADNIGAGLAIDSDGKLVVDIDALTKLLLAKLPLGISDDEDNALSLGSDKKPYFPGDLGKL